MSITYFPPRRFDQDDLALIERTDSEIIQFNQTGFLDETFRELCVILRVYAKKLHTLRFFAVCFSKSMYYDFLALLKDMPQIVNLHLSHPKELCRELLIDVINPAKETSIRLLETTDTWSVDQAFILMKTLRLNRKLHFLNLDLPVLSDPLLRELITLVKENKTLCTVHLSPEQDQSSLLLRVLCKELRTNALRHGYTLTDPDLLSSFNRTMDGAYLCFTGTTSQFSVSV